MYVSAVIVGAGHAGLAMSRRLTERAIDHVVLERGEVARSWRDERWNSLRLLTPNWQLRLPGMAYDGDDPDGYLTSSETAAFISAYASAVAAPVRTGTTVTGVRPVADGYEVVTDRGRWRCAAVVVASGACNVATVPAAAEGVPTDINVRTPLDYRGADDLGPGGVLVVGASATGVQLAEEIHASGRPVTLAVGEHVRMPRTYRGRDIFWWTDAAGILDERHDQLDDLVRARNLPSPQLVGSAERRTIDLNTLADRGITIVGRLGRIADGIAQFSGSLANTCALADLKVHRLLVILDEWATAAGVDDEVDRPERLVPTRVDRDPTLEIDLRRAGIATIVFATGYRPDHSWLRLPVFDHRGRIRHDGGVVRDAPGVYVVGLNVLRRRRSSFISGAEHDSADIARALHGHLGDVRRARAG